jgi:hypothetical protein
MIRSRLPLIFLAPHDSNRKRLRYTAPYHVRLNRAGSNGRLGPPTISPAYLQGHETLFIMTPCQGMASPHHQQPRCTITTTTTTVQKHELRGKLGIGSTLGHSFSIFPTSEHCNPTPPFACYKRGGRDPQLEGDTARQHHTMAMFYTHTDTHTLNHSNTPTHRDLGAIPLSLDQLVSPYYKHFGAK